MESSLQGTHVGFVVGPHDGDPVHPSMLSIEGDRFRLDVPVRVDALSLPAFFAGPGDEELLPHDQLLFSSVDHTFWLADLRRIHRRSDSIGRQVWTYDVDKLVETGPRPPSFHSIHGLRSEIVGLPSWLTPNVFSAEYELNEKSRLERVTFTAQRQQSIHISSASGLSVAPYFEFSHDSANGTHHIRETVQVESLLPIALEWSFHVRLHRALQDLVSLAFWHPCNLISDAALRFDDGMVTLDGQFHGSDWRDAKLADFGRRMVNQLLPMLPKDRQPLFYFNDIGSEGVSKWFEEYEALSQAMWVLSASLFRQGGTVEVQLLQIGTALEALGYELACRSGRLVRGRRDSTFTFTQALTTIAAATDCTLDSVTKSHQSSDAWAASFNSAYKGVKHADNAFPDALEAYQRAEEGALLARLWLARHLGVNRTILESRL